MGQTECTGKESPWPRFLREGLLEEAPLLLRLEGPLHRPKSQSPKANKGLKDPKGLKKVFHSPCGHPFSSSADLCIISYSYFT